MTYSRVYLDALGYELPPVVVTSAELEARLAPTYRALRLPAGQLEALTGIAERRWWDAGHRLSDGAAAAARHALAQSTIEAGDLDVLVYAGVCRELFEPATACRVASEVGVGPSAAVHDVGNACLGVLNGIVDVANRIELGQAKAGLVVSCESAREINDVMIARMLESPSMETYKYALATLTGGSGAVAVLLSDGSFGGDGGAGRRRLVGGASRSAPQFHGLCQWGLQAAEPSPGSGPHPTRQFTWTDAAAVLKHGVELGRQTWEAFLARLGWTAGGVDKVVCHQVGAGHRDTILRALGLDAAKEFSTFAYLGNMGTVSLPLSAALADDRGFLNPGDRVALLGIGSGLNCLMLGLEW